MHRDPAGCNGTGLKRCIHQPIAIEQAVQVLRYKARASHLHNSTSLPRPRGWMHTVDHRSRIPEMIPIAGVVESVSAHLYGRVSASSWWCDATQHRRIQHGGICHCTPGSTANGTIASETGPCDGDNRATLFRSMPWPQLMYCDVAVICECLIADDEVLCTALTFSRQSTGQVAAVSGGKTHSTRERLTCRAGTRLSPKRQKSSDQSCCK
eukprot:7269828-Prymnesium_polylepis.1